MSLRTRLTSFVAGFGLAGGATFYQLHKDITAGTQYLAEQVCVCPGQHQQPALAAS